ncbi:hypothetical protein C7T94_13500 [Pedobacter yulinensis]|uniref:HTH araC/xylS-type domain-containing protein n=1 Tax=Pedobacter yulinensis TaxID=2126353 RepID=A0A2T3HMA6_9SPHI|nr:helix-turn-helix domain-containing protein [Pedobacter yulinensis]PST83556.1 hypothetical protein C7T94_13500 [Pedobacter yulinensis]
MIRLQFYSPDSLKNLIRSFWCLEVPAPGPAHEETIIPDGHQEIILFAEGPQARRQISETTWAPEPQAFVTGQHLQPYRLRLMPGSRLYGIRFQPHTLPLFFDVDASLLTDRELPLQDLPGGNRLNELLQGTFMQVFGKFEDYMLRRLRHSLRANPSFLRVDHSVQTVCNLHGQVRVEDLVKQTGISGRHFNALFMRYAGVSPKTFVNMVRLQHFINLKLANPSCSLTHCTYEAGFFDQSHLNKTFLQLTGQSPKAYFSAQQTINTLFLA